MFKTYEFYQLIKSYDNFGQLKEHYELINSIEVQMSIKQVTTVQEEVIYNTYLITGVTAYDSFELKEKYKLVNDKHEYEIENIMPTGRLTLLNLKEVV